MLEIIFAFAAIVLAVANLYYILHTEREIEGLNIALDSLIDVLNIDRIESAQEQHDYEINNGQSNN